MGFFGDFMNEMTSYDADGDGIPDLYDTDGNGVPDSIDADGDGILDGIDYDEDGVLDAYDTDGDGVMDLFEEDLEISDDIDEIDDDDEDDDDEDDDDEDDDDDDDADDDDADDADNADVDDDEDGFNDKVEDILQEDLQEEFVRGGEAPAFDRYNPSQSDPSRVVGNPMDAADNWHWQETGSSCAVASQEFVLEVLTGREFHEADLRDFAESCGWYSPEGGTSMSDVGNILEAMGIHVEKNYHGTFKELEHTLANGGEVIVGVDSNELWYGKNEEIFGPGQDADHAIHVIGVDYTNPDDPMVIINDPGASNGGGAAISLDSFMDAWEDSGCFMVSAYA